MLRLAFSGWCQIRLSMDPDPFDEPAGVSGWTIALASEPPLDRIIRFRRAVAQRSHAAVPGVRVTTVFFGDEKVPGHPLSGAHVDLLDQPVFEGRNGLVADAGREPIEPFVVRIEADGGLALQRKDQPLRTRR